MPQVKPILGYMCNPDAFAALAKVMIRLHSPSLLTGRERHDLGTQMQAILGSFSPVEEEEEGDDESEQAEAHALSAIFTTVVFDGTDPPKVGSVDPEGLFNLLKTHLGEDTDD